MNEYDSNRILDLTRKINYLPTKNLEEANCYILNTCHIREKATDKVYHDIGRVKKKFRNKSKPIILVAGCVAQAEGEILIKKEKYIDAVIGPQSYHQITDMILNLEKKIEITNKTEFSVIEKFDTLNSIHNSDNKISTYLTIQEGCDKFCKFCVVPYTRGAEFSRSIKEIVNEAHQLIDNGAQEITLLGQNVNAYNYENNRLSDLIKEITKIKDLKRIRYTTSHPIDFSEDLIEVHKYCEKLMPLVHLPVQSGSDKILKMMNRKHTIKDYLTIVEKLIEVKPNIKFSSDFIIGYPGETKEDHEKTIKLLKDIKFINTFSFIYSARPGTPASKLAKIPDKKAKERLIHFQSIAEQIKLNYRKQLMNKTAKVLIENEMKIKNNFFGRDEYFNPIVVKDIKDLSGKIKNVKIIKGNQNSLYGEVVNKFNQKNYAA